MGQFGGMLYRMALAAVLLVDVDRDGQKRRQARWRLFVEPLEDRCVLDTTFTDAAHTDLWGDPNNWTNGIPFQNTNATIQAGTCTVDPGDTPKANQLTITGGSLTITGGTTLNLSDGLGISGGTTFVNFGATVNVTNNVVDSAPNSTFTINGTLNVGGVSNDQFR